MLKPNNVFREFLDLHPISARQCFELAQVDRTTFSRWLNGQSKPPAATLELFRLHATLDPATLRLHWQGWTFNHGKLWTPANRGYSASDIELIPVFHQSHQRLREIEKNYALQSKLF